MPSHRLIPISLVAGLGLILVWQVMTRSVAAYLARGRPAVALVLNAREPTALANLAGNIISRAPPASGEASADVSLETGEAMQRASQTASDRLGGWAEIALNALTDGPDEAGNADAHAAGKARRAPLSSQELQEARSFAERALSSDPLNVRALRLLGQVAVIAGDRNMANRYMRAAAARSLGESQAVFAMLRDSFARKDYAQVIYYSDALLRKRPQLVGSVIPMLASMSESDDRDAFGRIQSILAANPPWRRVFFANLLGAITDARTPLKLYMNLKDTKAGPTSSDLSAYLGFLIDRGHRELAYYTWLQFLPPEQLSNVGYLANGGFDVPLSGFPFDWAITPGSGVTIDIMDRPDVDHDKALFIEFGPGRADFKGVSQLLMLAPGNYRVVGRLKGQLAGRRGVQWLVACAGTRTPLGEGPMFLGSAPTWDEFDFTFTVPETYCRGQTLRLSLAARSASEQLVSGSVWYDDMRIERIDAAAESEAPPPVP
jgi:hypothetical protein